MKLHHTPALAGLLSVLTLPAFAAENIVELRLDADSVVDLLDVRAFAEPICPVAVTCAAGNACLVDAFDFGIVRSLRRSRLPQAVSPDGRTTYQAQIPQIAMSLQAGFKDASCAANPACADLQWAEVHDYTLVFDLSASGDQLCASLSGFEGEQPPAALAAALRTSFGRLCGAVSAVDALDLRPDGDVLAGALVSVDAAASRLALRYHLNTGVAAAGPDWAGFLGGAWAPDDGAPFSLFVDGALLARAAARSLSDAAAPTAASIGAVGDYTYGTPGSATDEAAGTLPTQAGSCAVASPVTLRAALTSDGSGVGLAAGASGVVGAFDERLCGTTTAAVQTALNATLADGGALFASRLATLGGVPVEAASCAPNAAGAVSCTVAPQAGELFLGGNALVTLGFVSERVSFVPEGALLSGDLSLNGPVPERVEATLVAPQYTTAGACGAQTQDYRGSLALRGTGRTCSTRVIDDPLGIFVLTARDRSGYFTDVSDITLNPDARLRARYFAAPYPLRIAAQTTAGARAFQVAAPRPANGGVEEIAERMIAGVVCRTPAVAPVPAAGQYQAAWSASPPQALSLRLTMPAAAAVSAPAALHQMLLTTAARPVVGAGGRFSYTRATFTLRAQLYAKLANGSELVTPVSVQFVGDATGTTRPDGSPELRLNARQSLTYTVPAAALPRGVSAASVPVTIQPASVRFVGPPTR
jgi:hypothetical protein